MDMTEEHETAKFRVWCAIDVMTPMDGPDDDRLGIVAQNASLAEAAEMLGIDADDLSLQSTPIFPGRVILAVPKRSPTTDVDGYLLCERHQQ
jgi:hypothetical protein